MKAIAYRCSKGNCPTVYELEDAPDDVVIQGYDVDFETPEGESAVRVPRSLIEEALTNKPVAAPIS